MNLRPSHRRPSFRATVLLVACLGPIATRVPAQAGDDRIARGEVVARILDRWLSAWEAGNVTLDAPAAQGVSPGLYGERVHSRRDTNMTHRAALRLVLDDAIQLQTTEIARVLLTYAAIGLDGRAIQINRAPFSVRVLGHEALVACTGIETLDVLRNAAAGRREAAPDRWQPAMQSAALLVLGDTAADVVRPWIERQLGHDDRLVRLAAAQALRQRAAVTSIDDLADALAVETDPLVTTTLVSAIGAILLRHGATADETASVRALGIARDRLGHNDWRSDLDILDLCEAVPSIDSIPDLIAFLGQLETDRANPNADQVAERTGDVLTALTGALIPDRTAAAWTAFWTREGEQFVLPQRTAGTGGTGRTVAGFFGIPVRGARIVFVLDVSGSMNNTVSSGEPTATPTRGGTRFDVARREVLDTLQTLSGHTRFGVILFSAKVFGSGDTDYQSTADRRATLATWLSGIKPLGGTNLFGALERALDLREARWGDPAPPTVDEIFLLSDGAPSTGRLIDPEDILATIRELNHERRVRIHTVFIGTGESSFMQRLAEENGGRYLCVGKREG